MKEKITRAAALIACIMMLASCGKVTGESTENSSSEKATETTASSESPTDDSSEAEPEKSNGKVLASVKATIASNVEASSPIPDGDKLYEDVRALLDPELGIDGFDDPDSLTVAFKDGDEKYVLSYCGEDVVAWRHKGGTAYYMLEHKAAEQLRARMAAYAAVGTLSFVEGGYSIDLTPSETNLLKPLHDKTKKAFTEQRGYYVGEAPEYFAGDNLIRRYGISRSDDGVFYNQYTFPYYSSGADYYEFVCHELNGYCRVTDEDIYYETNVFTGELEIESLPSQILSDCEYSHSFTIKAGISYTVEVYDGEKYTAYLMFDGNGDLCAEWSLTDYNLSVISEYSLKPEGMDIDEMLSYAAEHTADKLFGEMEELPQTKEEWAKYDTERYGLFDLSGEIVEGQQVSSNVVAEWREYISGGNPFTIEQHFVGAGRDQYEVTSSDGVRYYNRTDMDTHDGDRNVGGEEIYVNDGYLYQSSYYLDEYDKRDIRAYPMSMYNDGVRCPIDLLFKTDYDAKMTRAYEVTIDGEGYVCEEWDLYLDRHYKVYIKDGKIVGYLGDFYKDPVVYTFLRLERNADETLIKKPKNAKEYQSND